MSTRTRIAIAARALAGCGGDDDGAADAAPRADAARIDATAHIDAGLFEARPYAVFEPSGYAPGTPAPLIIALHGAGQPGLGQGFADQLRLFQGAEARTWLVASPDGVARTGDDGCCRWNNTLDPAQVDDLAYLSALIDDVHARFSVDPARIHVVGFSSGGFMAYVLGCSESARLASVVALAGNLWTDASFCQPAAPLTILQIHGEADEVVGIGGGTTDTGVAYRSAAETLAFWADANGCTGPLEPTGRTLNVMADTLNPIEQETAESRHAGCPAGIDVSLWSAAGQNHQIAVNPTTMPGLLLDYLDAHPRPAS